MLLTNMYLIRLKIQHFFWMLELFANDFSIQVDFQAEELVAVLVR